MENKALLLLLLYCTNYCAPICHIGW